MSGRTNSREVRFSSRITGRVEGTYRSVLSLSFSTVCGEFDADSMRGSNSPLWLPASGLWGWKFLDRGRAQPARISCSWQRLTIISERFTA
jgi:hypothetical protein